jgi:hypothetical protein
MVAFETDFMGLVFSGSPANFETVHSALEWYNGMTKAAEERNVVIQWCLAYPSDMLISTRYPSVTNVRASQDYVQKVQNAQEMGGSSLLIGSMNLLPSKDVFWSTSVQPPTASDTEGNYTYQPHVELDVALALFSCGPFGIGDALGYTNAGLVQQALAADGMILKPARPMSWVDSYFFNMSSKSVTVFDIRSTHSQIGSLTAGYYFLSWNSTAAAFVPWSDFYPHVDASVSSFYMHFHHWQTGAAQGNCVDGLPADQGCASVVARSDGGFTMDQSLGLPGQYNLARLTPVLSNGWSFLGDMSKYASVSSYRFSGLTVAASSFTVTVNGSEGEAMLLTAIDPSGTVRVSPVLIPATGSIQITFPSV